MIITQIRNLFFCKTCLVAILPVKLYEYFCVPTYQNDSRTSIIKEIKSFFVLFLTKTSTVTVH